MNLQFDATYTPEDYVEAQRLHLGQRPAVMFTIFAVVVVIVLIGALLILDVIDWRIWLGFAAAFVLWVALVPMRFRRRFERRMKKSFEQRKDFQVPYQFSITDQQISVNSPGRGGWISPWSDFLKWNADDKTLLLYLSNQTLQILPRRFFPSDADFAQLKELLSRTVGPPGIEKKEPKTPPPAEAK
jgi:hypothetical protein